MSVARLFFSWIVWKSRVSALSFPTDFRLSINCLMISAFSWLEATINVLVARSLSMEIRSDGRAVSPSVAMRSRITVCKRGAIVSTRTP